MRTPSNEYIPLLLHTAAAGYVARLRELATECDFTARDNAALRRAVRHGRTEAVQYLLEAGALLQEYVEELLGIAAPSGRFQDSDGIVLKTFPTA